MELNMEQLEIEIESNINYDTVVEGLLFIVGDEGLKIEQTAEVIGLTIEETQDIFDRLTSKYSSDTFGIEIVIYGGVYKFLSKAIIHSFAKKLFQDNKKNKLSQSALETLAIVAYKQPVTRVEVEELRGVGCDMMLRKLVARNLIRESGRSEAPGRPILYEVTDEFMDSFKLYSLNELPELNSYDENDSESDIFQ
jgi:segregation and condensation protein B